MAPEESDSSKNYILTSSDKAVIESILKKTTEASKNLQNFMVITLKELCSLLNEEETAQLKRVYTIDPSLYGFKKLRAGVEPVPKDLVFVEPQPHAHDGVPHETLGQYIPKNSYKAYKLMAKAMQAKIGKQLLIESSYRSSANQAVFFLTILKQYDYDLHMAVQHAAVPGYSEHGTPSKLAFDFLTIDGHPGPENPELFEKTEEYDWLMRNAYKYDFYLTYPRDNTYGVMFEPWHWRHVPPKDS